ncbi:hypothetical protein [Peredibacter starrii]|uniref:Lipoprotein n=1 Tax=Peredibacter starrii TaxID=28202 RepID=A0AAX4HL60_9BACT|nr:hypothetical protein [Peredibacter starrii]WPU63905.1 hypothetical protein SOO65_14515 [Peredibacter starrii]
MKYISILALGALLVSCSSHKPAPTKTPHMPHLTWMDSIKMAKSEMRSPASVKEADFQEMIKTMKRLHGWKTVPVGKAITKETTYYGVDGKETDAVVEMVLKQRTSSYFVLSSHAEGWELNAESLETNADVMSNQLKKNLSSIKKTGSSTYLLGYKTEIEGDSITCEVKVDFNKSPLFYNNECKDAKGQVFQESKTVEAKDINLASLEPHLKDIAVTVCPSELREEEIACVTDEHKQDWSYLIK